MSSHATAESALVDGIPLLWVRPDPTPLRRLVILLNGFTGTKEGQEPYLHELADAGMVGLSFDLWQHGERGTESSDQLGARVFGDFRRFMWPILGQSTLDTLRVIDWAMETLAVAPEVSMGGFSLGGDIAVAAAGLDTRIRRVAAMIATPDWLRPGMHMGDRLLEQGTPDSYARFFYERLNPLTHPTAYAHRPAITFEVGADDRHVPPDGALRFEATVRALFPGYGDALRVTQHADIGHELTPLMWQYGLEWLTR